MAKDKETDSTLALEVERERLKNENLKLQLEIENKRNPKTPDQITEEQLERARAAERKALDELANGTPDKPLPHKFHVSVPGNYPTSRPRHEPHLVVGASQPGKPGALEAAERYNAHMGIVALNPQKKHQVVEVGGGPVELAVSGAPSVDFTPLA